MNRQMAQKLDTEFYIEYDKESTAWCIFGNVSGFAWESCSSKEQAEELLVEYKAKSFPVTTN